MRNLLNFLTVAIVNGVTAEAELNTRQAADGRHQPFITSITLPDKHIALPEGTILVQGAEEGQAEACSSGDDKYILGVLNTRVDADEQSGNIMIHGSCPAEILKWVDGGELADANAKQIEALRGIGIFV
jgi:hypothetical protein